MKKKSPLALGLLILAAAPVMGASLSAQPLASEGRPAPGTDRPALTRILSAAANQNGRLAMIATAPAANGQPTQGLWIGKSGAWKLVLQVGQAPPDGAAGFINSIEYLGMDASGGVLAQTDTRGRGMGFPRDVWYCSTHGVELVARANERIPGARVPCDWAAGVAIDADGTILLEAAYTTGVFYYIGKPGNFTLLATPRRLMPGAPPDARFDGFLARPASNDKGEFFFLGNAAQGGIAWRQIHWFGKPGGFKPVVAVGDPAPGLPAGHRFARLSSVSEGEPVLNSSGRFAFFALALPEQAQGHSVEPNNGLWAGGIGRLELIARTQPPPPGVTESSFFFDERQLFLDDGGRVYFGGISGRHHRVWFHDGKTLSFWGAAGSEIPLVNSPTGLHATFATEPSFAFAPDGRSIQIASLYGGGVAIQTSAALVLFAPTTGWTLVARAGDELTSAGESPAKLDKVLWVGTPSASGSFPMICTTSTVHGSQLVLVTPAIH